jgi:hypothetical protein
MTNVDLMLARAQVWLAAFTAMGVFGIVFVLMLHHTDMDSTTITILTSILSVLSTVFVLQMNFFFARTRPPALPDPTPVNSTTTISTPNGPSEVKVQTNPLVQPQPEIVK